MIPRVGSRTDPLFNPLYGGNLRPRDRALLARDRADQQRALQAAAVQALQQVSQAISQALGQRSPGAQQQARLPSQAREAQMRQHFARGAGLDPSLGGLNGAPQADMAGSAQALWNRGKVAARQGIDAIGRWTAPAWSRTASATPSNQGLSSRSINMIKRFEGFDQPGRWPGARSGITLGHGYDLGYMSKSQFRRDWAGKIPAGQMRRLERAIGVKGAAARRLSPQFRDIKISRRAAGEVFQNATLPTWVRRTRKAFPGFDKLSPDAKGALTSLVFNRGPKMSGGRRREMRALRSAIKRGDLQEGARQIRNMKRLWRGRGLNGLLRRRDAEARMLLR